MQDKTCMKPQTFGRKSTKQGASTHDIISSKQDDKLFRDYSMRRSHSHSGGSSGPNSLSNDEQSGQLGIGHSSLEPSRYVSQEELDALKGCVMRRRALFSPSPSSSPVHSYVHQQYNSPQLTNSLPLRGRHIADEASHVRQGSLEYDHLKDFNPYIPVTTTDSVSVQFNLQGDDNKEECGGGDGSNLCEVYSQHSLITRRHAAGNKKSTLKSCDNELCNDKRICECGLTLHSSQSKYQNPQISASCDILQRVESYTTDASNSWPRKGLYTIATPGTEAKTITLLDKSKCKQLQQSPFHSKYNSPLLLNRPCEEGMKTCDIGSSYSLYSQTTTVSSLTDRQHCSYSEGVDGTLFKDRTNVSTDMNDVTTTI